MARARPGRLFDVTHYGAKGDGATDSTVAIEAAIAAAASAARLSDVEPWPTVRFPAGTFLTRPFNLTGSHLVLEVEGTVKAAVGERVLRKWRRIPPLPTYGRDRDGARKSRYQALVLAANVNGLRIRGSGTIDGSGPWWWERRRSLRSGRPHLLELYNCSHVEVSGVTLRDSAFWTLHPVYSSHVWIHHVTIRAPHHSPNTDGVDPDSCRHVLIEHNNIAVGDDHVAIKSGLSPLARAAFPRFATINVTVRRNTFRTGFGVCVGSETAGGIRDVTVSDNLIVGDGGDGWTGPALHLKTTPTRGNVVEDVRFVRNRVVRRNSFIRLETNFQVRGPEQLPTAYPPTVVRRVEWRENVLESAPAGKRPRAAWMCPANASLCRDLVVTNNRMPSDGLWKCAHVGGAISRATGNSPAGLDKCIQRSAGAKPRRKGGGKWRTFEWAKAGHARGA